MYDPTMKGDQHYKCTDCDKSYVKKGFLSNHMKKIHNKDDSPIPQGFLDNTSYSEELDMEETVLRNVANKDVANNFFRDITCNESEDENDMVTSTQRTSNTKETPTDEMTTESNTTPDKPSDTPAPVPLCKTAHKYIIEKGKTLPASFLATVLPAQGFLGY